MLRLAPTRPNIPSLGEFFPYAMEIHAGLMLCKDGGFLLGYSVESADFLSVSDAYRDYIIDRLMASFNALGVGGWSLHYDFIRDAAPPSDPGEFPDPITQGIDDRRVTYFNTPGRSFLSEMVLVIRWSPPRTAERRFLQTLGSLVARVSRRGKDGHSPDGMEQRFLEWLGQFEDTILELEDVLSTVLGIERMRPFVLDDDPTIYSPLLAHLYRCLWDERRLVAHYPMGLYTDVQLADGPVWLGTSPRVREKFVGIVCVDGFPSATEPAVLAGLSEMQFPYRWSSRFIPLTDGQTESIMRLSRRKWEQAGRSFANQYMGHNPMDARQKKSLQMVADIDEAQLAGARYGYYTSVFVVRHSSAEELLGRLRAIRSGLAQVGCHGRIERENASEGFLGSMPGDIQHNIRRPLLHTGHYTHLIPISSSWEGEPLCPSPMIDNGNGAPLSRVHTHGGTVFDLNLHDADVGHTVVFGRTGSGKSVLLAFMAAQWLRYPNARVAIFDKGQSLRVLTMGLGAQWSELGYEDDSGFAPIASLAPPDEPLTQQDQAWVTEWVEHLYALNVDGRMTPEQGKHVSQAVSNLAAPGRPRSLLDLYAAIQDKAVKEVIEKYCGDSPWAPIFDDESGADRELDAPWMCFEIDRLLESQEQVALPLLMYLFYRIERAARGDPTLIILDEAWAVMAHSVFKDKLVEWLKTMRKKNVAVIMATQSPTDMVSKGIAEIVSESCPTMIFAGNPDAEGNAPAHGAFGLTGGDVGVISRLMLKREYYLARHSDRKVFRLELDKRDLRWLGISDPARIKQAVALRSEHPDDWQTRWESLSE